MVGTKRDYYVLLNPGPVLTSARVRRALFRQPLCHRDSDFSVLFRRVQGNLRQVFRATPDHSIILVAGTGTAAMEMAIASVIPPDRRLLVASNGCFGERFAEIAGTHEIPTAHLRYDWGQEILVSDVAQRLKNDPKIFAVAMTHHETSVGRLNPLTEIGAVVHHPQRIFIVDGIASLGAEDLDVVRDQIDICIATPNKCLHGIAGISILCIHPRLWDLIQSVPPRSYYLDLKKHRDYSKRSAQTPFTAPVNLIAALDEAVSELLEEGLEARAKTYRDYNLWLRTRFVHLGLEVINNHGAESHSTTCLKVPDGLTFHNLYASLKKEGFIIYDGKAELGGKIFQVSNMGDLSPAMLKKFTATMEKILGRAT